MVDRCWVHRRRGRQGWAIDGDACDCACRGRLVGPASDWAGDEVMVGLAERLMVVRPSAMGRLGVRALAGDSLSAVATSHFASFVVASCAEASAVPSLPYLVPAATGSRHLAEDCSPSFPVACTAVARAKTHPGIPDSCPFAGLEVVACREAPVGSLAAAAVVVAVASGFGVASSFAVAAVVGESVVVVVAVAAGAACTNSCCPRRPAKKP